MRTTTARTVVVPLPTAGTPDRRNRRSDGWSNSSPDGIAGASGTVASSMRTRPPCAGSARSTPIRFAAIRSPRSSHPDSVEPALTRIATLRTDGDVTRACEGVLRQDRRHHPRRRGRHDADHLGRCARPTYVTFRISRFVRTAQRSLRYQAALVDRVDVAIIATTVTGLVTKWNRAAEKHLPAAGRQRAGAADRRRRRRAAGPGRHRRGRRRRPRHPPHAGRSAADHAGLRRGPGHRLRVGLHRPDEILWRRTASAQDRQLPRRGHPGGRRRGKRRVRESGRRAHPRDVGGRAHRRRRSRHPPPARRTTSTDAPFPSSIIPSCRR